MSHCFDTGIAELLVINAAILMRVVCSYFGCSILKKHIAHVTILSVNQRYIRYNIVINIPNEY